MPVQDRRKTEESIKKLTEESAKKPVKKIIEKLLEKAGTLGSVLGLETMRKLMEELGDIQEKIAVIHVAGTNGKGSVGAMLEQILCLGGYRVGRYSSPAVFFSEEKYRVDGKTIEPEAYDRLLEGIACACERMEQKGLPHPTLFEIETAVAFLWFYQKGCRIVVLETGLGGNLDATNIIKRPLCSVITSISMDHMKFLGNTLGEIAEKKAGIIKEGCPVISSLQKPEAAQVIRQACRKNHAKLCLVEQEPKNLRYEEGYLVCDWKEYKHLQLSLLGAYQAENAACVIETICQLKRMGYEIVEETIRMGLRQTVWPGRFEVLCREPLFVMDGAHNEGAAQKLRKTLEMGFTNRKIIYIIGVLADKAYEKMLKCLLPLASQVYTVTPDNPRALSGAVLCEEVQKCHSQVQYVPELKMALEYALEQAEPEDMILAFGSLSYLGDLKREWEAARKRK